MPAGKRRQSNATLYTLITFVALFIVATTVAVIYYVKAEELRTTKDGLQDRMNSLVNSEEDRNIAAIVGTRLRDHSSLGTVVEHLDQTVMLVKGAPVPATTSAEVKAAEARRAIEPLLARARAYIPLPVAAPAAVDPNAADPNAGSPAAAAPVQVALTTVIGDLLAKLDQTTEEKKTVEQSLATLKDRYDDSVAAMAKTKQELTGKVDEYAKQVGEITTVYDKLKASVDQSANEQIGAVRGDLDKARADAKQLNENLLKMQAELNVAQVRLQGALTQVSEIRPAPDKEAPAFQPDGQVILVDEAAGVIRINLGSDDRVYRGLTFSVYDKGAGIPRDGKPKAQVEVFAVDQGVSAARVLSSDRRNPIATNDIVANLIWDAGKENQFVVVGDFDLDGDGKPDYDAARKIESLIQKWGGAVAKEVSPLTDYVILGTEPRVPAEPTVETLATDPTATERYNAARQRNEQYNQVRQQAEVLWVPIFNYDRFLYFTGYASQVGKPGAF